MQRFLSLMQKEIAEQWEQNGDEYIMMEFVNSEYVLERLVLTSGSSITEGTIIQEPMTYHK